MECAEIRSNFVLGRVPAGPAVDLHLAGCANCRELFAAEARLGRSLAQGSLPEAQAGELFALVEREVGLEVGVRARLRALSTRARSAALLGVAVALMAHELWLRRRPDFAEYSPSVFWGVALALGATLAFGARRLLRGDTAPLGGAARERAVTLALLLVPALAALVAVFGAGTPEAVAAWGKPANCFAYGAALVLPLVLLYWLLERRDRVPTSALWCAGGLAGVAANLLLHAHCGSANWGHLLLGHASIGVVWALALQLVWRSPRPLR